jgi:hypothetical protein
MKENHNIQVCIALSKRIIKLKKCILSIEQSKCLTKDLVGVEFKEFNDVINSIKAEILHIEHFIPRLLQKVYPLAIMPERFYFSSFDIKSNTISIMMRLESSDYQKLLSLTDGRVFDDENEDD